MKYLKPQDLTEHKIIRTSPVSPTLVRVILVNRDAEITEGVMNRTAHKTLPREMFISLSEAEIDFHALLNKHHEKLLSRDPEVRKKGLDAHHEMISKLKDHIERYFGPGGAWEKEREGKG